MKNKMIFDGWKISLGLIIFILILLSPAIYNLSSGITPSPPVIELPTNTEKCVMPKDYMRNQHMDLLNNWRHSVVREGKRDFIAFDGTHYDMSLTNTCMKCHTNKSEFCDRCHNYSAVGELNCWRCHNQ
jgi:hypothetical protein